MDIQKVKHFHQGGIMALIFILGVSLGLAYFVGSGNYHVSFGLIVIALGFALGVLLGEKYYYLIPIGMTLKLPALPLGGGRNLEIAEAAIMGCIILAILRFCMKRQKLHFMHLAFTGALLYTAWVVFILWQSPVGFSILGGTTGGGRFYLKIILGFAALVILANQRIGEVDAKRIVILLLGCTWISTFYSIANFYQLTPGMFRSGLEVEVDTESFYSWHQVVATPALFTTYVIFAFRRPSYVFSLQGKWLLLFLLFAIAVGMFSGKRAGIAVILMVPLIATVFYREWKYTVLSGVGLVAMMAVIALGQGNWFHAPLSAQRALSWLPADWDPEMRRLGTGDIFREYLRHWAIEEIQQDPVWGRKGFQVNFAEIHSVENSLLPQEERTSLGHALSSNWHNTWLGTAADFGIPAAIFFAIFTIQWLILSYKASRLAADQSALKAISLIIFFSAVVFLMRSHTSGHSALNAMGNWWMYGLTISIYLSLLRQKRTSEAGEATDAGAFQVYPPPTRRPLKLASQARS